MERNEGRKSESYRREREGKGRSKLHEKGKREGEVKVM